MTDVLLVAGDLPHVTRLATGPEVVRCAPSPTVLRSP